MSAVVNQIPAPEDTSDMHRKKRVFLTNSGFANIKMLVFLSALAAVIAAGGYLLYYASKNPILVSTPSPAPSPEPRPEPAPAPEPAAPSAAKVLADQTDAIRDKFLSQGMQALEAGDAEEARQMLQAVLRIDPENSSALKLLPRAESIERVSALMDSGKEHEQKGAYLRARKDYQKALSLDSESGPAKTAVSRMDRRIIDERFQKLMSAGMAELESGNPYAAQDAFIKAKNIKPEAVEVKDALNQVDAAIRLKLIDHLKKEAADAEQAEDWRAAADSYLAVLKVDDSLRFALEGKARSLERFRMDKRLRYYLENPDALTSGSYLQKAVALLERAAGAEPKGPEIRSQIETLKGLIRIAKTPIKVVIASDNTTEVAVYKVGKFGRFKTKELHLRPGTYTIVGVRDGFKDVRHKLVVKADKAPLHVIIRCEEQI